MPKSDTKKKMLNRKRHLPCDFKHLCPAVNANPKAHHVYEFDFKIAENTLNQDSSLILVQFHGTPAETKMRDAFGCVTKLSFQDYSKICNNNDWYQVSDFFSETLRKKVDFGDFFSLNTHN